MVPNHLFQLLAMVAMEPPAAFGADAVRGEKAKVVGAIRPWTAKRRCQFGARSVQRRQGRPLAGYRDEANVGLTARPKPMSPSR
jgi:glucose-6-phosphate 1-dehydrogenase